MTHAPYSQSELYAPIPSRNLVVGCMDDRPWERPWLQIAGGAHGATIDRTAAMELQKPGSFTRLGIETHVLAGMAIGACRQQGLEMVFHEQCASFELAEPISDILHNTANEEVIFADTKQIDPGYAGMSDDKGYYTRFMPALRAQRRATEGIVSHSIAEADLFEDDAKGGMTKASHYLFVPPKRVALTEADHEAPDVVVNQTPHHLLDSRRSWNDGQPAYGIGIGQFELINQRMNTYLGKIGTESFVQVSAVRHGALTALALPKPAGTPKLQLHVVKDIA
ncbi:MAG TPA: hypothetical protein VFI74_03690 [Candidatus Saccharimonadales bacterium]|nr:hypothetical protein [Candidatus Saccharimonadales bacterium]